MRGNKSPTPPVLPPKGRGIKPIRDSIVLTRLAFDIPLIKNFILILPLLFVAANAVFIAEDNVLYVEANEANPLIEYIREHIKDDEYVYSYAGANSILRFKNGYDTSRIGNTSRDNIIYGNKLAPEKDGSLPETFYDDLGKIITAKKCWLLFNHHIMGRADRFIDELKTAGSLEEVMNVHGAQLYYFRM